MAEKIRKSRANKFLQPADGIIINPPLFNREEQKILDDQAAESARLYKERMRAMRAMRARKKT